MLIVDDLTKRFPGRRDPAIEGIDLEVHDGEVLGLVGLNGAGKTTTIRVAAGISLPSGGHVSVDGKDIVREKRLASERIGWVPELFPFEPRARALPLLIYFAGFHGLTRGAARNQCRDLLAQVGLGPVERGRLGTFSQGMKKRFSLASAMVADPPNLLLDEVLNGLDPEGIAFVRRWITRARNDGKAVLLSSHLLTELEALADRIAFVHQGQLLRTIGRAELASAGVTFLRIRAENLDTEAIRYLEGMGEVRIDGPVVLISHPKAKASEINAELVRRGCQVSEIRTESTSLESYFLDLIGAAR